MILPYTFTNSQAAAIDGKIYFFGGLNKSGYMDTIGYADPETNDVFFLDVKLPNAVSKPTAIEAKGKIYIVGGDQKHNGTFNQNITIFTPPNKIENIVNGMPYGVQGCAATFDGEYLYFFGNCQCEWSEGKTSVIRLNTANNEVDIQKDALPFPHSGMGAVYYKGKSYLFGGRSQEGGIRDTIVEFTWGQSAKLLSETLSYPVFKTSAVLYEDQVYILGGQTNDGPTESILRVDMEKMKAHKTGDYLRHPRASRAHAMVGNNAYLVGGDTHEGYAQGLEEYTITDVKKEEEPKNSQGDQILVAGIIGGALVLGFGIGYFVKGRKEEKK